MGNLLLTKIKKLSLMRIEIGNVGDAVYNHYYLSHDSIVYC